MTQQPTKRSRRRKVYVNPMIQGRLLVRMAVYWGLYHVVLWHAMFLYRFLQYRDAVLEGAPVVPFWDLYTSFVSHNYPVIVCALAVFPVVLWDMLSQTHRVAGPLVRFQNAMRQLLAGVRVDRIQLRKDDLLMDFQDTFNEFLEWHNSRQPASRTGAAAKVPDDHGHVLEEVHELQQSVEQAVRRPETESRHVSSVEKNGRRPARVEAGNAAATAEQTKRRLAIDQ